MEWRRSGEDDAQWAMSCCEVSTMRTWIQYLPPHPSHPLLLVRYWRERDRGRGRDEKGTLQVGGLERVVFHVVM
jgi:hypothetical protein